MTPSGAPPGDAVLRELAAVCGTGFARPAGAGDTVAEVPARWVAAPDTVRGVVETLGLAARHRLAVVARGAGSKLEWGAPPSRVDVVLDTSRLAGVWQQSADGTSVEVGAGTPLWTVQAALAAAGQRVALDPPSPQASVGGVIATDEAGPLRHRFGTPREQLISVSYVRADGTVTDSGGRRSPGGAGAGSDPGRLLCGSYGALGILVSATFRLDPAPAARVWVSRSVSTVLQVHDLVGELLAGPVTPGAVEVDLPAGVPVPARGRPVGGAGGQGTLAVLVEHEAGRIGAAAERTATVLGGDATVASVPPPWWGRYPFGPGEVGLKLAVPLSDLPAVVSALRSAAGTLAPVRGSAGVGVVYTALAAGTPPVRVAAVLDAVRAVLLARGGSCVVLTAPPRVRAAVDVWGDLPGAALLRQVKQHFDPDRRLAPGRFLGGL